MSGANRTQGAWQLSKHSATTIISASGRRHVASTGGYSTNDPAEDYTAENEANARLIAAAPELLEEMEALIAQAEDAAGAVAEFNVMPCDSLRAKLPSTVIRLERRIQQARAVLAKAKGGA